MTSGGAWHTSALHCELMPSCLYSTWRGSEHKGGAGLAVHDVHKDTFKPECVYRTLPCNDPVVFGPAQSKGTWQDVQWVLGPRTCSVMSSHVSQEAPHNGCKLGCLGLVLAPGVCVCA